MTIKDDEDEFTRSVMTREPAIVADSSVNFDVYALERDEEVQIADKSSEFKFNCQALRDAKLSDKNKLHSVNHVSYHKMSDETLTEGFRDSSLHEN